MRPVIAFALLTALTTTATACPWVRHSCPPCRVVYVHPCYPPAICYQPCPLPVIRAIAVPAPAPAKEVVQASPVAKADAAPERWCHIRGRVVFDGDPIPKQQAIPKAKGALTEDWVVDPATRGVANVIVWLAPEPTAEQWERLKATGKDRLRNFPSFAEKDIHPALPKGVDREVLILEAPIAFVPRIVAVRAGADVVFKNLSTRADNVKWSSQDNGEGSPLVPPNGKEFRIEKTKPERLPIAVDSAIHPWMRAWVKVFDHPYFAVTAPDGTFEIKHSPTGNLRLFIWQETTGYRNGAEGRFGEPIQVPSGRFDLGDVKIKPRP
jgi:hypothetical protein